MRQRSDKDRRATGPAFEERLIEPTFGPEEEPQDLDELVVRRPQQKPGREPPMRPGSPARRSARGPQDAEATPRAPSRRSQRNPRQDAPSAGPSLKATKPRSVREKRALLRRYLVSDDRLDRGRMRAVWRGAVLKLAIGLAVLALGYHLRSSPQSYDLGTIAYYAAELTLAWAVVQMYLAAHRVDERQEAERIHDELYLEHRQDLDASGAQMLDLAEAVDVLGTCTFEGPVNPALMPDLRDLLIDCRKGADGRVRYSPCAVTRLVFTADQVLSHEAAFDLARGRLLYEMSREVRYADVVSAQRSREQPVAAPAGPAAWRRDAAATRETFRLELASGKEIAIVLRNAYGAGAVEARATPGPTIEETIRAIRRLLSDKKQQAGGPAGG